VCGTAVEQLNAEVCPNHARALESVRQAYESWATAFSGLGVTDFLKRVLTLEGTGKSAREIAEFLQRYPEKWKR
jgi:hypothetical protein